MITGRDLVTRIERLPDAVAFRAAETPDQEAVVFGEVRYTYAELDRLVTACAFAMAGHGVDLGDRVAVLSTPRPEFLITMLAAMRLGAIWVGLNPKYKLDELVYVARDCEPKLLFSIERGPDGTMYDDIVRRILGAVPSMENTISIGGDMSSVQMSFEEFLKKGRANAAGHNESIFQRTGRRDPAVLVYTSGSTGKPKGALLAADGFFHSYKALSETFVGYDHLRTGHRFIANLPINHVGGQSDTCGNALIDGGTIIFMESFDPAAMLVVAEQEKITILGGLPLMIRAIFDQPHIDDHDLSSVKVIAWGGAAMPRPLLEKLSQKGYFFSLHYGLTEGGSICSVNPPNADLDTLTDTIGRPDHDNNYRVVDAENQPVEIGEVGEVQISGPGLFLKYWNRPEATAAAFTPDGWFKTGDLVEVLKDGYWRFAGRSVEMFKSGGYNVYPREVELALEECPGVAAAFIISMPDDKYDEVGWAFVIPAAGAHLTDRDLRLFSAGRLANYKIPKRFQICQDVPMLPIGKVDKRTLKNEALKDLQSLI